eukprot:CAMPEP_0174962500 /NCGR_PEP_ID=MMETSP0004_2-20121128/4814_1 /TAXON_ID=420556 /ORGANISM="Ochromonas sp., Strain CCMP1393" /LENGTH=346 /DNA_ID=CAMNT_0016211031 /DNA_START=270 /DNA_END=1310 /DNA_ORIENTATION=-
MRVTLSIFLCFSLIFLACLGAPAKKQSTITPEAKYQQISDLASKSKGNVITLDDSTYNYYAISKPRPYTLLVLLTATHPKFKCGVCKQLDSELMLLAESYAKSVEKSDDTEKNVFFIRLDYEASQKVFQNYGVTSVPFVFHLGPQVGAADKSGGDFHVSARDRYQRSGGGDPDAESLAQFLQERTNVSVKIQRSMIGSYILLLVLFGILAALVQPVINSLPFILRIVQWRPLWLVVSCGVYTCAISGLIYDIIRSPQMYYANPQTGQIMFFYPQSGTQFVVEGFVIGFLNLGCAGSLALITMIAPKFKDEQNRTVGIVGGIIAFAFCFRMVRNLYIMKNQWYGRAY